MWFPYCRIVKCAPVRPLVILLILSLFPVGWGVSSQVEKTESLLLELKDEDWEVRRDAASELKRTAPVVLWGGEIRQNQLKRRRSG